MPIYYKLTECSPGTDVIYTDTDLSGYGSIPILGLTGQVGTCYSHEVTLTPISPVPITIVSTFNTCAQCLYPCFNITSCDGLIGPISVLTDLSAYIGSTISVDEFFGECFFVEGTTNVLLCTESITVTNIQPCDCNCYTLISCQPALYPNLYLQSNPLLEPFVGQLININGDITKKYTVEHSLQYIGVALDTAGVFCNPLSFPVDYKIISFIYNGSEYVITPYTYSTTTLNFQALNCTGLSCVTSTCLAVNNYTNFADMLNGFFSTLSLPVQAYPYTDSGTKTQIAISYLASDSFSLSVDYSAFGGGSLTSNAIFVVDSSGSPIRYYNGVPMVVYTPYIICAAPSTSYTSIAAATPCTPYCFTLTNCDSSLVVNTLTDLSSYIGLTVEVTEYPGECFTVVGNLEIFLCTDTVPVTGMTPCSCTPGCGCPDGYVLLPDGITCQQILTVPATYTPTIYQVGPGEVSVSAGTYGANIYEDITAKTLPIAQVGSALYDNNGAGTILTATNHFPFPSFYTLWITRLQDVAVWTTVGGWAPYNQWIGFSVCVTVPETKTYCIGLAADNRMRFSVNGVLNVTFDAGTSFSFTVWHIIPLTLNAGTNIITLEGYNDGLFAGFGAEIYNATPTEILAVNTQFDLLPYIVFSTKNLLPPNPVSYFDVGETSGYTCPPGYVLSTCDGIVCQQITQTPGLPCCYNLTDCVTGTNYIVSADLSAYVGLTVSLNEITGCLLVIDIALSCEGALVVTLVDSFADCTACAASVPPCYLLTDECTETGISFVVSNDLSDSLGQVIKVCPSDLPDPTPTGINTGVPIDIIIEDPGLSQYNLINCCDPLDILIVSNTLEAYIDQIITLPILGNNCWTVIKFTTVGTSMGLLDLTGGYVYDNCGPCMDVFPCGTIIIPELLDCICFTISEATSCDGAIELVTVGPITATCLTCLPPPPTCYLLTDCQDIVDPFIVCDDLSAYLDLVIKIQGCGDTCWLVTLSITCDNSICLNGAITEFETCLDCLPVPPIPDPLVLHSRRIKPGYFSTNSCLTTEYIERVNCTFALEVYNQMIIKRYGVTVCCDNDLDQWAIKKQGLDFELLTDPALCKSTICTCKKPCLVSATFILGATCYPPIITSSYIDLLCGASVFVSGEIVVEITPVVCNCYSVAAPEAPITIVYIDCCCKVQTSTITSAVQFCALFPPVNYDIEPLVITATGTCGDETCDPPFPPPPPPIPCYCYSLYNNQASLGTYSTSVDCYDNEVRISPIRNKTWYLLCSRTIPIVSNLNIDVALVGDCADIPCISNIACRCVDIELIGGSGTFGIAYKNCNGDIIEVTVTDFLTVCAIGTPWATSVAPFPIYYTFSSSCECLP